MTGGERYDPWRHLALMTHVAFGVRRLPHGHGWWLRDVPGIALDDRLGRIRRRCVLAHELVHAEHDDPNCATQGPDGVRIARWIERRAERTAARRLIDLDELAEAIAWAPLCPEQVADQLDVTTDVLLVRLRQLTAREKDYIESRLQAAEGGVA